MKRIANNLYIGKIQDLDVLTPEDWRIVNVASAYHYKVQNWKRGQDYSDKPTYIFYQKDNLFSVNWIDGQEKYFDYQGKGVENFNFILAFIDKSIKKKKKVIIVCEQALSRSPSVALVYLARKSKTDAIVGTSFELAQKVFKGIYPKYAPNGIADFINHHWNELGRKRVVKPASKVVNKLSNKKICELLCHDQHISHGGHCELNKL